MTLDGRREPDIADELAHRALVRAASGLGIAGLAFGVVALAFLVVAGGRLSAQSVPQLVLLGFANVACLLSSAACYRRVPGVRGGQRDGPSEAAAAAVTLTRAIQVLFAGEMALAATVLATVRPLDVTIISVVLSLAVAAQAGVVALSLRGGLRRAARRRRAS